LKKDASRKAFFYFYPLCFLKTLFFLDFIDGILDVQLGRLLTAFF